MTTRTSRAFVPDSTSNRALPSSTRAPTIGITGAGSTREAEWLAASRGRAAAVRAHGPMARARESERRMCRVQFRDTAELAFEKGWDLPGLSATGLRRMSGGSVGL